MEYTTDKLADYSNDKKCLGEKKTAEHKTSQKRWQRLQPAQKGVMSFGQHYPGAPCPPGGVYPTRINYSVPFFSQQPQQQALGLARVAGKPLELGYHSRGLWLGPVLPVVRWGT